ncbi:hypothetical protein C8J57DRAFT_1655069 [Mycena rebaudengoi]|nr:hypothetical protein C8J57DRAFT_1655069 [Mycena rebaudengoi]
MILLLLLVHTLSGRNLGPRATVFTDSCEDINNCRKLFDIVWGCLVTIFACTWVSVHPNVPPPNKSPLTLLLRRLKMMLIAIIAPELMVGFAARQFFTSRCAEHKISKTHGFFISMGGFVSHIGHYLVTTLDTVHKYLDAIRMVDVEDIKDKSKGDVLSKGIAFAQGAWFMALFCTSRPEPSRSEEGGWGRIVSRFFEITSGGYDKYNPAVHTSVPSFWSSPSGKQDKAEFAFYIECLVGTIFGAIHCVAWTADFASTVEMWMWRSCALLVTAIPLIIALCTVAANMDLFEDNSVPNRLMGVIWALSLPTYSIARLFLIVLPLIALRAPAAGSLMDFLYGEISLWLFPSPVHETLGGASYSFIDAQPEYHREKQKNDSDGPSFVSEVYRTKGGAFGDLYDSV